MPEPLDIEVVRRITEKLYRRLDSRRREIDEFENYDQGEQPLVYASDKWRTFHKNRYDGFSDNWCGVVANAPSERLKLLGLRVGDNKAASRRLWDIFERNEGQTQSEQSFHTAVVARRAFARVWGDPVTDEPTIDFLHPSQAIVDYDPSGRRRRYGLEGWIDDDDNNEYAHLYTHDHLYKLRRSSSYKVTDQRTPAGVIVVESAIKQIGTDGGWEPYQDAEDNTWPLPNPMGKMPIVELANRPRLGRMPLSDIAGTMAMQNAINLLWAYLFGAADHASLPARVVTGQDAPKIPVLDKNGQKIGEREVSIRELEQGRLLWLTGDKTKIAQWDAARLDVFTDVIEVAVGHIASQTRTPSHYLIASSDNVPASGYELAEAGLVSRVEQGQSYFGGDMRDVIELVALADGSFGLAEEARTATVIWHDAAIRNEAQRTDALQKKRTMGYPLRYILELEGKTEPEIDRIMRMVADERTDPLIAQMARDVAGGALPASALQDAVDEADVDDEQQVSEQEPDPAMA